MTRPTLAPGWPEPPGPAAFIGLAGTVVGAVDPHTEANRVAVLVSVLAARRPGLAVLLERDGHYPPDVVLDGELAAIARALQAGRPDVVPV